MTTFTGRGDSPLAQVPEFVNVKCPELPRAARDRHDGRLVDSSWYDLRFGDPKKHQLPIHPASAAYWMPVDFYSGGVEHAILHLLYSWFFTRAPRGRRPRPGRRAVQAPADAGHGAQGRQRDVEIQGQRGRVARYGADALRLYVMFVAPPERKSSGAIPARTNFRFLVRLRIVDHWAETVGGWRRARTTEAERTLRRKTR